MIYVVGDSHSSIFSGADHIQPMFGKKCINEFLQEDTSFYAIRSGAQIAYNLINKYSLFDAIIAEYEISKENYLFFSFGEIDIRCHILPNKKKRGISLEETVKECVDRYIQFLMHYKDRGFKIGVWAPIPSVDNLIYVTEMFNKYLQIECEQRGILFKSISKALVRNKIINRSLYMDRVHASYQQCKLLIMKEFQDIRRS